MTSQSDLYAVGAVAYYLLVGDHVFMAPTLVEIVYRHVNATPEPPSQRTGRELSKKLEEIILQCLNKDPAERPGGVEELARLLASIDDVEPWTQDDARHWWERRASQDADLASTASSQSLSEDALVVDMGGRG